MASENKVSFLSYLRNRLSKAHHAIADRALEILRIRKKVDAAFIEELEEMLIQADLGVQTVMDMMERLQLKAKEEKISESDAFYKLVEQDLISVMTDEAKPLAATESKPTVYLIIGVNGTGKTTTIGKLAARFRNEGKEVILGAADTFRAAAVEQIEIWANRSGSRLVKHASGGDPAAVAYDAVQAAKARQADYVIIDTAGRLHTKVNLMEELKKINRVIAKELPGAPHEVLLVLDATTGQNAVSQAELFSRALPVTGLVLTKLDGTAKGGIVISIQQQLNIPVKLIGVGESIEDLRDFEPQSFVKALFE